MPRRLSKSSTDGSKFSGSARQTTLTTSYTGPKGDKGDAGADGADGADAATPNWTLQTSTVAAGTPTVSATGTYPNQTITLLALLLEARELTEQTEQTEQMVVTAQGFTGGSYNSSNGTVTFTSDDGLGFTTGDLRGLTGLMARTAATERTAVMERMARMVVMVVMAVMELDSLEGATIPPTAQ